MPYSSFTWLEELIDNLLEFFYKQDIIFQYLILFAIIYILLLGTVEFIKKVLVHVPIKIFGIIVIIMIIYFAIVNFKT